MAARASLEQRRRFLMALSELTKDNPEIGVQLAELAQRAGITLDQARYAFVWVIENAFASGNWTFDQKTANVQITVKGSDEVQRLKTHWLKRLLTNHTLWAGVAVGVLSGVVVGIILKWLP
jgi:hypothetical protein